MKHLLLASLITLLAFGTACGQAAEPAPEPVASDGIQVHGHWTVTVTNPDGTVDAVHEFENALYTSGTRPGGQLLTALVAGETQVTGHYIVISSPIFSDLACKEQINEGASYPEVPATATRDMTTVETPVNIAGTCTVILAEGVPSTEITGVFTGLGFDPAVKQLKTDSQGKPATSAGHVIVVNNDASNFTQKKDLQIPVVNTQMVTFNVIISFS